MKKIKTLLISFSIILALSIGGAFYFNSLGEKLGPQVLDDCFWICNGLGDGCPSDELEYKACYEKNEEICVLCKVDKGQKALLAEAKQEKYYNYMYSLIWVSFTSGVIILISFISYLSIKYSFIRTIGAVSVLWTIAALTSNLVYSISTFFIFIAPVLFFWLFRFIRFGPIRMFKDG
ncbi:MAG: hypothetical protein HOK61_12605 [Alphaproteobacteria bacterium]|jgi:hypothetical protein|nr:hypothetical protein [Alphaproteobacteria bacterium]